MTTFVTEGADKNYERVYFRLKEERTELSRYFERTPFIPSNKIDREKRCDEILTIQAMGLKKRLCLYYDKRRSGQCYNGTCTLSVSDCISVPAYGLWISSGVDFVLYYFNFDTDSIPHIRMGIF